MGLGVTTGPTREELVVDPGTGRLLGRRFVLTEPGTGMRAGLDAETVADYTSVTTGVVGSPDDRLPGA